MAVAAMDAFGAGSDDETVARIVAHIEAQRPFIALHPRWTERERAAALAALAPLAPLAPPPPGIMAVLFTSGTTARPRPVALARSRMLANARASVTHLGLRGDDRWLLCLSPAHVAGLGLIVRCHLAGARVVAARFDAARLPGAIERDRITVVSLVPAMLARVIDAHPVWRPPAHLRAVVLGGDAAPASLLARAADLGWPVLVTYGLTEAGSQVTMWPPGTRPAPEEGCGPPLPGIDVRIAADGEIHARVGGDLIATGDLGRLDTRGRLHVLGRKTDVIVTGGENVAPAAVERALEEHPAVAEACVFGVPDETWGAIVAAALVARGALPDEADLRAHIAARLAPFARPRRIAWLPALPRTPAGKIDRDMLAAPDARRRGGSGEG